MKTRPKVVAPIEPTKGTSLRLNILLRLSAPFVKVLLRRQFSKITVKGQEHLKGGAKLLLMNHSTPLDPAIMTYFGGRVVHFLVTEPYMRERFISKLLASLGQIPKRKLDTDTRSIRTMKKWAALGGVVGMFPEGQFSWTGEGMPLQPGLSQLVEYLDLPVVIARLKNGNQVWPAWAKVVRRAKIELEIDPPFFLRDVPGGVKEVESYIEQRIRVPEAKAKDSETSGVNLALGLSQFLRNCFSCGKKDSLIDRSNQLECQSCHEIWNVDYDSNLTASRDPGRSTTVRLAFEKVKSDLEVEFNRSKQVVSKLAIEVWDASKLEWMMLDEGMLTLTDTEIKTPNWSLSLYQILTYTRDWDDIILLRTERSRIALRMVGESRALWMHLLNVATKRGFYAC